VPVSCLVHRAVVLSIGKLATGQERYYEQQVAQGLDDYFTGRGESPGRWLGRGAAELGLRGTVEDGELSVLMGGRDPRAGRTLREQPVKVAALDLTFSAPKSVSVLHAVADERVSAALVGCHEEAVAAALGYLEETAVFVSRRTGAGLTLRDGGGFVTAAFRDRMSRALDPQLHTHCVSANMARGKDGRWTAVHHPSLFRAAWTAGYLYQAHLRALVCERLGLEWANARKGAAELVAIDREVLEEFSRREEVQARAAEHGLDRDKRARVERVALNALEHGPGASWWRSPTPKRELADRLAGPLGLTEPQNTFDRRAVLRALAQEAQQGARVEVLVERGHRFAGRQDVLRTDRGELTTAELVAVERRLIATAQGRACEGVGRVDHQIAERARESAFGEPPGVADLDQQFGDRDGRQATEPFKRAAARLHKRAELACDRLLLGVEFRDLVAVFAQQTEPQRRGRIERPPPNRALQRSQSGAYRLYIGQPLDQLQGQIAQQRFGF
jgi:conjugative relaxase-like TrwC/TraI family protein